MGCLETAEGEGKRKRQGEKGEGRRGVGDEIRECGVEKEVGLCGLSMKTKRI